MLRSSLVAAAAVLLCGAASAQNTPQTLKPLKIPKGVPVKDAGIYHLSTGSWTRGTAGTAAIGLQTAYSNDASSGYFTGFTTGDIGIDEGELAGTGNPNTPGADRDAYVINGFTFAYCADFPTIAGSIYLCFFESYSPCGDPSTLGIQPEREFDLSGIVPGTNGTTISCWIITFDLMNTTASFKMKAEGDGTWDGSSALDSFGWYIYFSRSVSTGFASGPLLNGDPNYYAFGGGCYYSTQGPIPCTNTGTGLGTQDQFFGQGPGFLPTFTCYFFGGYKNTIGPNLPSRPFASMWMCLYSDGNDIHDFLRYCASDTQPSTSTGLKSKMILETQDSNGNLLGFGRSIGVNSSPNRLQMIVANAPGPGNGGSTNIGYFLMGTGQNTFTPPGSIGPLCIAPGLKRYLPPVSKTNETITFHNPITGTPTTLTGQGFSRTALGTGAHPIGTNIGTTSYRYNFQAWHRDGTFPSNLSDAICVDFTD
jgi:hypothetical protein